MTTDTEAAPAVKTSKPITLDAAALKAALASIKPAIASRGGALPVLTGVRFTPLGHGRVELCGTDLELTITRTLAMSGPKCDPFVAPFALTEKLLAGVKAPTKTNPEGPPVTITTATTKRTRRVSLGFDQATKQQKFRKETYTETDVTLELGNRRRTLRCLPAEEYPRLQMEHPLGGWEIDTDAFAEVISFTSSDDARPILTGLAIEPDIMIGTDSYRLGTRDIDPPSKTVRREFEVAFNDKLRTLAKPKPVQIKAAMENDHTTCLLPARALRRVVVVGGTATMHWVQGGRSVQFSWPDSDVVIITRVIEGVFPNWRGLWSDAGKATFTFGSADELRKTLRTIKSSAREINTPVRIEPVLDPVDDLGIRLKIVEQDVGTDEIVIEGVANHRLTAAFNPDYLLSILADIDGPVTLRLVDQRKPAQIVDGPRRRLIMPVRVN